jgi:hypothetical protein
MASAQTVMVVLDIEYIYVGHGESSGARNMHLVKVVTKEVWTLGTSPSGITDTFWLCLSTSVNICQPVRTHQLTTATWPLCRQKDNVVVFDTKYLTTRPRYADVHPVLLQLR